jgi:hypothetical protein
MHRPYPSRLSVLLGVVAIVGSLAVLGVLVVSDIASAAIDFGTYEGY